MEKDNLKTYLPPQSSVTRMRLEVSFCQSGYADTPRFYEDDEIDL